MPSRLGSQPFSGWPEALPRSAGHLPRLSLQGCPWWLAVLFLGTRGHCFLKTPASAPASAEVILPVTVTPMGYTGSDPQPLVLSWLLASSACPHTFPNVWLLCQPPFLQSSINRYDDGAQWAKAAFVSRKVLGVFWRTRLGKE